MMSTTSIDRYSMMLESSTGVHCSPERPLCGVGETAFFLSCLTASRLGHARFWDNVFASWLGVNWLHD